MHFALLKTDADGRMYFFKRSVTTLYSLIREKIQSFAAPYLIITSMSPHMPLQQRGSVKGLQAHLTRQHILRAPHPRVLGQAEALPTDQLSSLIQTS